MNESQRTSSTQSLVSSNALPWVLLAFLFLLLALLAASAYWRSSSVGSQVQVPMFYDAHYLFPRPWTQEQTAPGVPEPAPVALYGDNVLSQSFVAGSDQLSMVSLWMAGPQDNPVQVTLSDESGASWETQIFLSSGYDGDEYAVSFPAFPESNGRRFTLTLVSPQVTAEQPVIVRSVGGDRLGNSLRLNEFIRPGNLAISTYAKGSPGLWWLDSIGEQLLPALFRMRIQQYKPPQFKGALFSWLLVITAGLSAVLLVLASPNRRNRERPYSRELIHSLGWFLVILLGSFLVWQVGSGRAKVFVDSVNATAEPVLMEAITQRDANPRVMADLTNDLWTAVREPEARFISTDVVQSYPTIRVPGDSRIRYALTVPPDGRLRVAQAAVGDGAIKFSVVANDELLFESEIAAQDRLFPNDLVWQELDLSPWLGQGMVLSLETSSQSEVAEGLWIMPQIITEASWLLPDPPANLEYLPVGVRYEDTAELLGVGLEGKALQSGDELAVKLLWRPLRATDSYGKVFVHLIDGNDQLVAQHDGQPVSGAYPIAIWQPGTVVMDEHILQLDQDLTSGPYRLEVGIYDPDSLIRWTAESANGLAVEDGRVVLELPAEVLP